WRVLGVMALLYAKIQNIQLINDQLVGYFYCGDLYFASEPTQFSLPVRLAPPAGARQSSL
ncbi:MAG: hypothetical protein SNI70_07315, partial [Rikenellaceae bacterium]